MADAIDKKAKELVAQLCRHRDSYSYDLPRKEKEDIASSIIAVWVMSDKEINGGESVNSRYPLFEKISDIARDLDWPNGPEEYTRKDWEELIGYINQLEKQVNNPKSNNQSQDSQD